MPTDERKAATALAEALREVGLPEVAGRADALYYSDFSSPLALPKMTLGNELRMLADAADDEDRKSAIMAVFDRVVQGEFDG